MEHVSGKQIQLHDHNPYSVYLLHIYQLSGQVNHYPKYTYTVKPVYNGQPWGITKVVFVNRWPLFQDIYIYS